MSRLLNDGDQLLVQLCKDTGALGAWVRDSASPSVWWQSPSAREAVCEATLDNLYHLALDASRDRPLRQGHKLRLCRTEQAPLGFAYSFADIYILLLVFAGPFRRFVVEPKLRKAMIVLEKMIPLLPGSDRPSGAQKGQARIRRLKPPKV